MLLSKVEEGTKHHSFVNIMSRPSHQNLQRSGNLYDSKAQFELHIASNKRAAIENLSNTINNFKFDPNRITLEGWNPQPYTKVSIVPSLGDTMHSFYTQTSKQDSHRTVKAKPSIEKAKKYRFLNRRSISQQNIGDYEKFRQQTQYSPTNVSQNHRKIVRVNKK